MNFVKSLFLILISLNLLALTACSDGGEPTYKSRSEAEKAARLVKITCENASDCPEYVGGLIALQSTTTSHWWGTETNFSLGTCSQILIAPNKILTNRHCVPESDAYVGSYCSDITIIFPKVGKKKVEKVGCKSITAISENYYTPIDEANHPDWAVIELKRNVNRKAADIDASGIENKLDLVAYPVYYHTVYVDTSSGDGVAVAEGVIRKATCQSNLNDVVGVYYSHPQSPIFSASCTREIVKGNSGSGILDLTGKVRGVISMALPKDKIQVFMGDSKTLTNKMAGGTIAHCISEFNASPSEACKFDFSNKDIKGFGLVLAMMYGLTSSEEQEKYVLEILNRDESVVWEDHNPYFFSTIYKGSGQEELNSAVGEMVGNFASALESSLLFPHTPKCISDSRKTDTDFLVKWPHYQPNMEKLHISDKNLVITPVTIKELGVEFNYDVGSNSFVGELPQLNSVDLLEYSENLPFSNNEKIIKSFGRCLISSAGWDCTNFNEATHERNNYVEANSDKDYLIANEDFMIINSKRGEKIIVPVCEN